MSDPKISRERVRQFALDGGLSEEAANHFLDSQCHMLQMRNLHAVVAQDVLPDITNTGVVVHCSEGAPECVILVAWVPFDHSQRILNLITDSYKNHGMESPYQYMDLEGMDSAMVGRDYIHAMLIGAAREGQDIS